MTTKKLIAVFESRISRFKDNEKLFLISIQIGGDALLGMFNGEGRFQKDLREDQFSKNSQFSE